MNTGLSGAVCVQAALALAAVILVLNPLTMTLFVHMSFARTVYLLLFDALAIAVAFYALRHFRDGRRRDLIGAIVLLVAIPVLMLLAEPAIATLDGWVNDGELAETRADDAVHRPDTLAGWVPVPNAIARHAIEGRFDVTYELDESGRKAIPKNPGAERTIHFFGDSFTFGFGVSNEDTALNLVARALGERANVANWAVMGYGLEQIFLRLRDVQEEIQPGDIVVFAPISHDLLRNLIAKDFVCDIIYHENGRRVHTFPVLDRGVWRSARLDEACPSASRVWQSDLPLATIARRFRRHRDSPAIIENADWILTEAKAIAERRGAQFEILFVVDMVECLSGSFTVAIEGLRTPFSTLMEDCPASDEAGRFTFPADAHLNPAGNRWLAQAILKFLHQRVLKDNQGGEPDQPIGPPG